LEPKINLHVALQILMSHKMSSGFGAILVMFK